LHSTKVVTENNIEEKTSRPSSRQSLKDVKEQTVVEIQSTGGEKESSRPASGTVKKESSRPASGTVEKESSRPASCTAPPVDWISTTVCSLTSFNDCLLEGLDVFSSILFSVTTFVELEGLEVFPSDEDGLEVLFSASTLFFSVLFWSVLDICRKRMKYNY
jgi:hypothetical protein